MKQYLLMTILLQVVDFRGPMNNFLNKILIPLYFVSVVIAAVVGLVKNWDAINDVSGTGRRKEGFISVAYSVGYTIVSISAIAVIVSILKNFRINF